MASTVPSEKYPYRAYYLNPEGNNNYLLEHCLVEASISLLKKLRNISCCRMPNPYRNKAAKALAKVTIPIPPTWIRSMMTT